MILFAFYSENDRLQFTPTEVSEVFRAMRSKRCNDTVSKAATKLSSATENLNPYISGPAFGKIHPIGTPPFSNCFPKIGKMFPVYKKSPRLGKVVIPRHLLLHVGSTEARLVAMVAYHLDPGNNGLAEAIEASSGSSSI